MSKNMIRSKEKQLIELSDTDLSHAAGGTGPSKVGGTFSPPTLTLDRTFKRDHKLGSVEHGFGFAMPVELTFHASGY